MDMYDREAKRLGVTRKELFQFLRGHKPLPKKRKFAHLKPLVEENLKYEAANYRNDDTEVVDEDE